MSAAGLPHGDRIPTPAPIVCLDVENNPMPRVALADAETLIARGWAEWRGKGTRRHLQLTSDAPLRRMPRQSAAGVRRDRADHTCRIYGDRQPFGAPCILEPIPLP